MTSRRAQQVLRRPPLRLCPEQRPVEVHGELHQLVETTATLVGCWGCGTRALAKGRREVRVRDLPAGGGGW
ncbi:MAG: hypothetical protein M3N28_01840 [Actinomycetota bacterium]|nr:hypothetical protein [Actinomycetota bacterium]